MKKRRHSETWFYDIETIHWDVVICLVAKNEAGECQRFLNPQWRWAIDSPNSGLAREGSNKVLHDFRVLMDQRATTVWAHAGGLFDHLLVWEATGLPSEAILAGSSVLSAKTAGAHGQITWRDTMQRWLCSLEKVGKALGLAKGDLDRAHLERYTDAEIMEYCSNDTEILRRGTIEEDTWLAGYGIKANTSGTAAVECLRAFDPETWAIMARNQVERHFITGDVSDVDIDGTYTPEWCDDEPRRDIYLPALSLVMGGRTETRRIGEIKGPIYVYDIHSSYPSQYGKAPMWCGCEPDASTDVMDVGWIDLVTWYQEPKDRTAFCLGLGGFGAGQLTQRMHWELAQALARRNPTVRRLGVGYRGTARLDKPAHAFSHTLFELKDKGGVQSFFAKVTLNSLHGRFGMNPDRQKLILADETADFADAYETRATFLKTSPSQQPIMAATVLGRGQLTWTVSVEALEDSGWDVYYGDTDSIHTNAPPNAFRAALALADFHPLSRVGLSDKLGDWGLEGVWDSAVYVGPKVYSLRRTGDTKNVAKGMPVREKTASGQPVMTTLTFSEALEKPKLLSRSGIGRFRSSTPGKRVELARTLSPSYPGRQLFGTRLMYLDVRDAYKQHVFGGWKK